MRIYFHALVYYKSRDYCPQSLLHALLKLITSFINSCMIACHIYHGLHDPLSLPSYSVDHMSELPQSTAEPRFYSISGVVCGMSLREKYTYATLLIL